MALDKNKLKQGLIDNYSKLAKDGGSSKSESSTCGSNSESSTCPDEENDGIKANI